jgi:hypothetical protein
VAALREEVQGRWGQALLNQMTPALLLVADKLDADQATLKAKLGA